MTVVGLTLAQELERHYPTIKEELLLLLSREDAQKEFVEYQGDGVNSDKSLMTNRKGKWDVFYFWQQFQPMPSNASLCPKTFAILDQLKEEGLLLSGMVCFSSLMPGSRIVPHTGPSNMRLTCHLGLIGCDQVEITAGRDSHHFQEGKCLIFDDSFLHEVQHRGHNQRVTLMLDLWHPAMNPLEISIFSRVMSASSTFMHPDEFFHSLKLVDLKKKPF